MIDVLDGLSEVCVRRLIRGTVLGLMCVGIGVRVWAQAGAAEQAQTATVTAQSTAAGGTIKGTVKAGAVPLPGVSVTATNTLTGKKYATTTDVTGAFAMAIPRNGRYVVRAELAAFAAETKEVLINAAGENGGKPEQVAEFGLQLASRVAQQEAQQAGAAGAAATSLASALGRGTQSLSVTGEGAAPADASVGTGNAGAQMPTLSGLGGDSAATESVAVSGQMGQTNGLANFNEDEIRQRVQDAVAQAQRQGGATGDVANAIVGMLGGMMGGPGGFGGGPGGGGGGRGGRGGGGGFRNFNPTQPHGTVFYQGGNGALNAAPFSVTQALGEQGAQVVKPSSMQNRFGVSFAGSPFIPGVYKANPKQFVFLNVTGMRNINPEILNGTVPTLAERSGDFSELLNTASGVTSGQLYDPATGLPILNNNLTNATTPLSPQAQALLNFYPAPNVPGASLRNNYQTVTNAGQNSTSAALRFVRNFGQNSGFGGGRRQAANAPKTLRQNINFNGSYSHAASDLRNIFLPLGGATVSTGYGVTAGYTIGYGRLTNNASINWNRSHSEQRNYFTDGNSDPLDGTGISIPKPVIGAEPGIYYGVPSLTIASFTGLNQTAANNLVNQTISFSDFVSYSHKKHNMRFGFDFRRVHADSIGGSSGTGSFTFTGYATQNPAAACATPQSAGCVASGSAFADLLFGLPQQSAIQAGAYKTYLRANVIDWYAQDDWRARPNLTLNYGLRYEYFGPYVEKFNRLVNLDHNADFTQVQPVQPGGTGQFSGSFPRSLVRPDRTMYSPRLGFAYRPTPKFFKETVIRGGYGINYNTGQYAAIARQLAFQPPFAITQTNLVTTPTVSGTAGCTSQNMTLASAFDCSTVPVQNNYAANQDYRLGYVQVWNIDIQRTLPMGIVTNIGYNGARGNELDMWRAPNRTATGLLNPGAQAFNFEDSLGYSRFNGLSVNVRKRLQKGVSLQATYLYGHTIDNASSIGGAQPIPAQNDLDLAAEEGNSVFDVRHKVTGNWVLELPFGPNRAYFTKGGFWSKALDGFSVSGDFTFATGNYFTPRFSATVAETSTGTNNTLRPDRDFAAPITGPQTIHQWFNAAAFSAPANGFGTASRGSIEGPGIVAVDASLSRTVALGETRSFEARVTANNVFNTVQYSGIDTTQNSLTFGQVTSAAAMRTLSVTARYRF
ncbi:MAG TPA: TonB-dependent receptor [Edaphobacter sp.]|nr:TonB-dependent receptor [Edaphobacter sp.]